jgi:hypothetical protein
MEAQLVGGPRGQRVKRCVAGEAKNVVASVLLYSLQRLNAAVMTVAAPHDDGVRPVLLQELRHMLDDVPHLRALRGARWAQDGGDRCTAGDVIDVHRRKFAFIVMRIPERKLLAAMCGAECVVDVEDLDWARLYCRAELLDHGHGEPRCVGLARRILQPGDRRLRRQRHPRLWASASRKLHQGIVPQPVKVDRVLVSTCDRGYALRHHLKHLMQDAVRIAAIRHRLRDPLAHTTLALRLAQQQKSAIGGLGATIEIHCEFLAADGW